MKPSKFIPPRKSELPAYGDRAKKSLPVEFNPRAITSLGFAKDARAYFDWYNDRLQILIDDGQSDDPAVYVRFREDGSIAEILLRDDLLGAPSCGPIVRRESGPQTEWSKERDGGRDTEFDALVAENERLREALRDVLPFVENGCTPQETLLSAKAARKAIATPVGKGLPL